MAVRLPRRLVERDPELIAGEAGLVVVDHAEPGIRRLRCGRGFRYVDPRGTTIRPPERDRLLQLAVPPAWQDVWLCPIPEGHLLATGFDDAERRQYRYHEAFRAAAEARKYERLRWFGRALPDVRRWVDEALHAPVGSRDRALGAALRLVDHGLLRVGNELSAGEGNHGATTLGPDHLVDTDDVELVFRGKGGTDRTVEVTDEDLADALRELADPDRDRLFWYEDDDGVEHSIGAAAVNAAVSRLAGRGFSAKDFRTWGGSAVGLQARVEGADEVGIADAVAEALGNTRAVARQSYLHPLVLEAPAAKVESVWSTSRSGRWLDRPESALRKLLGTGR